MISILIELRRYLLLIQLIQPIIYKEFHFYIFSFTYKLFNIRKVFNIINNSHLDTI